MIIYVDTLYVPTTLSQSPLNTIRNNHHKFKMARSLWSVNTFLLVSVLISTYELSFTRANGAPSKSIKRITADEWEKLVLDEHPELLEAIDVADNGELHPYVHSRNRRTIGKVFDMFRGLFDRLFGGGKGGGGGGGGYGPPKRPAASYGPPKKPQSGYGPPKSPQSGYGPPQSPKPGYGQPGPRPRPPRPNPRPPRPQPRHGSGARTHAGAARCGAERPPQARERAALLCSTPVAGPGPPLPCSFPP